MIRIYHHIYPLGAGLSISESQKNRIFSKIEDEFEYIPNHVKSHQVELWSLKKLQNDSVNYNDDDPILYIHTKGAIKQTVENAQWREYLERELIDNYKFHLEILKKGFDTSGVLMGIPYWSSSIYPGNFWWTTAGYIKRLPQNLGWEGWDIDSTNTNDGTRFGNGFIGWAETKFINKGENYKPYTSPVFNINGFEQFANLIAEEINKNKTIDKKSLIKGRVI
jgi:hypothetical protein